jgi:hypothetical protein
MMKGADLVVQPLKDCRERPTNLCSEISNFHETIEAFEDASKIELASRIGDSREIGLELSRRINLSRCHLGIGIHGLLYSGPRIRDRYSNSYLQDRDLFPLIREDRRFDDYG